MIYVASMTIDTCLRHTAGDAVLLDTHGKKDMSQLRRGDQAVLRSKGGLRRRYRAVEVDLNEGSDPKNSLHFGQVLNAAAYKRIAFTDFVPRRSSAMCKGPGPGYRMSSRRFLISLRC
jgi:hypothetical protein